MHLKPDILFYLCHSSLESDNLYRYSMIEHEYAMIIAQWVKMSISCVHSYNLVLSSFLSWAGRRVQKYFFFLAISFPDVVRFIFVITIFVHISSCREKNMPKSEKSILMASISLIAEEGFVGIPWMQRTYTEREV